MFGTGATGYIFHVFLGFVVVIGNGIGIGIVGRSACMDHPW